MNNEEKILHILTQMQADISGLKQGQAKLEQGQEAIRKDINDLFLYSQASFDEISRLERRVDEVNMAK